VLEINPVYVTADLVNPDSIPYFLSDSKMTVRQLTKNLAEIGSPAWCPLVAGILRNARPEDALFFLNLETIAEHWNELSEHLESRREFWGWLITKVRQLQENGPERLFSEE
jgi:hypothetical protein